MVNKDKTLSVVIPVHRYCNTLIESVKTLLDDGSQDVVIIAIRGGINEEILKRFKKELVISYNERLIIQWAEPRMGPSHYRNIGARLAKSDIVLFFDCDCRAETGLVSAHLKQYSNEKVGAVAGVTKFQLVKNSSFEKTLLTSIYMVGFSYAETQNTIEWAPSSNLSIRRKLVLSIPFDETFPVEGGGEDVDICWRIRNSGYIIKGVKNAVVSHDVWHPPTSVLKRLFRWGFAESQLITKHPERAYYSSIFGFLNVNNDIALHRGANNKIFLVVLDLFYIAGMTFGKIKNGKLDLFFYKINWKYKLVD